MSLTPLLASCDALHRLPKTENVRRVVEVAVFEGGYGIEWHTKIAAQYTAEHARQGIAVRVWGDPRAAEKVKPRILRGDPPELVIDKSIPVWRLIAAGKLRSFNAALDEPAPDNTRPWRDLFIRGTLDLYRSDGQVYAVPTAFGAWGYWYDARLFRRHGWAVPRTWAELNALCDAVADAGIAPVAFQGKYPQYAWFTYLSLVQRCGGLVAINRLNALEPGAFSHPDAVWAARLLQQMALRHFQKGAMAMTHTESQLQFVNNRAALICCGVWLENEMKQSIPPDFELRCFNVPAVEGGKGNPRLFNGMGSEFMFMPSDARNSDLAGDFARYMVSPRNAPDMGSSIGVISPLQGGSPRDALSPALQSVLDMIEGAPGIFNVRLDQLLLEWNQQVLCPSLGLLLEGSLTPEAFGRRLDEGLKAVRRDPDVIIPSFVPYDPAEFGEAS